MARKPISQDVYDSLEPEPAQPEVKSSAKNSTPLQAACAAIAARRQNDAYNLTNTADVVQYRNSSNRLVASVPKLAEKDVANRDTKTLAKANAALAAYKNFTADDAISGAEVGTLVLVVTKDGEKYRYDLTKNALV